MLYKKMLVLGLVLAISTVASQVTSAAIITGVERRNSSYDAPPEIAGPLAEGAISCVDRLHEYKRIPVALVGADYIKIANDDKTSLYYELDVTLSQDATLFLLLDNRLGNGYLPANSEKGKLVAPDLAAGGMSWVIDMGFVDTGDDIAIHEYRDIEGKLTDLRWLSVYARDVSAGKITLLPQDNLAVPSNYNMYGVAAISVKVSRDNLGAKGDGFLGEEERLFNPDNRHYYQRIDTAMSWDDAKKYCESLGGHLATVTSVEENAFIYKNFGRDHVCWLGGTDEAEEGKWRWVTGEPFTFQNWYRGQPTNSGKSEHYVALGNTRSVIKNGVSYYYRFGASWNDHVANGRYQGVLITFPVCEWDEKIKVSSEGAEWSLSNLSTIRRIVPNGWKGSWSPDGARLVFGKSLGKGLQILDTESGKTTDLTPSGKDPAWSPDGRFIAYIKEQRFNAYMSEEVWIVEPTGQSPRKIADAGYPHWSADGKLLFVQSRKENKIFAIDIDKPDAKAKVLYDGPQSWYPAVSSDGKRIAFGKRNALVVIDIEIGQTVLTWPTPGNRGLLPAWSPDGNLVAYGGFDNVSSGLWVLDMRTEEAVQVSKGPCTMPAWSMDGTKLAFDLRSGNRREIWMAEKKPKPSQLPVDTKPDRLITAPSVPARAAWTTLVPARSVWKYLDDGSIQGTAWHEPGFDDSSWACGPAELGYGDGNEATVVSYGMEEDYKYPTTYFRHSFNVPDASIYQSLLLAVLRDDGAVVYLNGTEIFRTNMPWGDIDYSTAASTVVGSRAEGMFYDIPLRANSLVKGNNVLAVEIHQINDTSTDISFDLSLAASTELVDALVVKDSMEKALADGLVAHWTFDERDGNEVYDAKGGNDGIVYGAKWVNGLFGGALSFDGDGDYISIKEKSLPKAGPYSISLWLRADGDYKSRFVAQGHDQNACWFHYYVSDKARFTLGSTTGGSGRTVIRGADNRTFGNYRLDNNRWAHMVVVFDSEGKAVKFYNNSAEARNRHTPTTVNYRDPGWAFSGTDVVIGSRGGASPWYNGLMDDIRIYDRALSGPEVKGLYQSGLLAETDNQEQDDQQDKVVSPLEEEGRVLAVDDFDGKSFRAHGTLSWGDRAPKWVGLMAFNGARSSAPEIDASFDFFEVRAIPAKAAVSE